MRWRIDFRCRCSSWPERWAAGMRCGCWILYCFGGSLLTSCPPIAQLGIGRGLTRGPGSCSCLSTLGSSGPATHLNWFKRPRGLEWMSFFNVFGWASTNIGCSPCQCLYSYNRLCDRRKVGMSWSCVFFTLWMTHFACIVLSLLLITLKIVWKCHYLVV